LCVYSIFFFFFSSRRRHTRWPRDWSSDVCSSDLIELLRSWGVNEGTQVVAYDAHGGMFAARVWWMLRWVGHEAVAVLDGGVPARSEERRVGKECRGGGGRGEEREKEDNEEDAGEL